MYVSTHTARTYVVYYLKYLQNVRIISKANIPYRTFLSFLNARHRLKQICIFSFNRFEFYRIKSNKFTAFNNFAPKTVWQSKLIETDQDFEIQCGMVG